MLGRRHLDAKKNLGWGRGLQQEQPPFLAKRHLGRRWAPPVGLGGARRPGRGGSRRPPSLGEARVGVEKPTSEDEMVQLNANNCNLRLHAPGGRGWWMERPQPWGGIKRRVVPIVGVPPASLPRVPGCSSARWSISAEEGVQGLAGAKGKKKPDSCRGGGRRRGEHRGPEQLVMLLLRRKKPH